MKRIVQTRKSFSLRPAYCVYYFYYYNIWIVSTRRDAGRRADSVCVCMCRWFPMFTRTGESYTKWTYDTAALAINELEMANHKDLRFYRIHLSLASWRVTLKMDKLLGPGLMRWIYRNRNTFDGVCVRWTCVHAARGACYVRWKRVYSLLSLCSV